MKYAGRSCIGSFFGNCWTWAWTETLGQHITRYDSCWWELIASKPAILKSYLQTLLFSLTITSISRMVGRDFCALRKEMANSKRRKSCVRSALRHTTSPMTHPRRISSLCRNNYCKPMIISFLFLKTVFGRVYSRTISRDDREWMIESRI